MKKQLFAVLLFILCVVGSNFAQETVSEKTFEIKGLIKDQENEILAGLNLYFDCGDSKFSTVSDENGIFAIKLPVGKCKITVNDAVSKKFTAFIEIADNNLNPTNFEMIVERNLTCCDKTSNGNITEVVKYVAPPYPAAAKAVRARGEVVVLVKIDKDGKVISSKAESGHPLLRKASEITAKEWLFSADETESEREGKIIFAFIEGNKETASHKFMKPNRLEVFSVPLSVDFAVSH